MKPVLAAAIVVRDPIVALVTVEIVVLEAAETVAPVVVAATVAPVLSGVRATAMTGAIVVRDQNVHLVQPHQLADKP